MISATRYRAIAETNRQTDLAHQIAKLQASVSSGVRIDKPSDDPDAAARIAEIRQLQADQTVWTSNVNMGTSIATAVDTSLTSVAASLDRAKELVLSGRNDTTSATDRAAIAAELHSIAADLASASTSSDPTGAPLFPTSSPLAIPVSDTLSLPATASRTEVFDTVPTAIGTRTMAQILDDAANAIQNSGTTRAASVQASLDQLDQAAAHVTAVRTDQGVRASRFDQAKDQLDTSGEALSAERSGLESTDLTYALSEFQSKQLSLQAAQTVFAKANQTSLFSLLG